MYSICDNPCNLWIKRFIEETSHAQSDQDSGLQIVARLPSVCCGGISMVKTIAAFVEDFTVPFESGRCQEAAAAFAKERRPCLPQAGGQPSPRLTTESWKRFIGR